MIKCCDGVACVNYLSLRLTTTVQAIAAVQLTALLATPPDMLPARAHSADQRVANAQLTYCGIVCNSYAGSASKLYTVRSWIAAGAALEMTVTIAVHAGCGSMYVLPSQDANATLQCCGPTEQDCQCLLELQELFLSFRVYVTKFRAVRCPSTIRSDESLYVDS